MISYRNSLLLVYFFQEFDKGKALEENIEKLAIERRRSEELLYRMMPKVIADRLRLGGKAVETCEVHIWRRYQYTIKRNWHENNSFSTQQQPLGVMIAYAKETVKRARNITSVMPFKDILFRIIRNDKCLNLTLLPSLLFMKQLLTFCARSDSSKTCGLLCRFIIRNHASYDEWLIK